jgi:1-acyl-sn-glycerol-3-phosphate acyltransferase
MTGFVMYAFLYLFIHTMRKIGWWRWSVEGLENLPPRAAGGMLLVANHNDWIDIPVLGAMLPFDYRLSWLAKSELFEHPVVRWFFNNMQVIPIKRGKRDLGALDTAGQELKKGAVLLIYPEGHRSRTGILQEGRGGAVRLAMINQIPLVPIAMIGTERGLRGTLMGKPVVMRIGKPYIVEQTPDGKIPPVLMEQLTTDMMRRIAALLPPDKRGYYTNQLEQRG